LVKIKLTPGQHLQDGDCCFFVIALCANHQKISTTKKKYLILAILLDLIRFGCWLEYSHSGIECATQALLTNLSPLWVVLSLTYF
jgi:hypothetical protein